MIPPPPAFGCLTVVHSIIRVCATKKILGRRLLHTDAWWSRMDVWMQRGGHLPSETWSEPLLSNDAILGWLTSQLTRRCFISFFRINVCLSSTSKATSQGSETTPSFIWFIYKACPCASLSFCTHLAVHGWLHWLNPASTNDVCKQQRQQQDSADVFQCLCERMFFSFSHDCPCDYCHLHTHTISSFHGSHSQIKERCI